MKKMFCRGLRLLVFAGHALFLNAQQTLKVGDALPKQFWETPLEMVNAPEKTTTLAGEKDKLLLLDFWATWCSSCLKNFPKMHQLEQQFGDRLKIFPVTTQDRTTVEKYFASPNGKKYSATPSAVAADAMKGYFPHRAIPYIIWIKNGRVLNTTDGDQVTASAIEELLAGKTSSLQTVLQIDKERPLLLSESFDGEKGTALQAYSFLSKGRIRGIGYGTFFHRNNNAMVYGRQFSNLSLVEIYRALGTELFHREGYNFTPKHLVKHVEKVDEIDFDTTIEGGGNDAKLYSVDFIIPESQAGNLYPYMLKFINDNTAYEAVIRTLSVKCYVLKRTTNVDKIVSKGGNTIDRYFKNPSILNNVSLERFISALNVNNNTTDLPVIDGTGYSGKVDLHFSQLKDLPTMQKDLKKYDLILEQSVCDLPMLEIRDHKHQK